jgi:septal ring factor EnvC (AmiA/AmiB activator)
MEDEIAVFNSSSWQEAVSDTAVQIIDVDDPKNNLQPDTEPAVTVINSFDKVPEVIATAAEAKPQSGSNPQELAMEMPCNGEVIGECFIDELVYSETMQDWRTHNGLDIAAKAGTQVRAAESGTVAKVFKDDLLGVVVTINHSNGVSTTYANLQSAEFIKEGTQVKKGDIIGGIGECGALESNMQPHLHFEVKQNGEFKNPREFIKG